MGPTALEANVEKIHGHRHRGHENAQGSGASSKVLDLYIAWMDYVSVLSIKAINWLRSNDPLPYKSLRILSVGFRAVSTLLSSDKLLKMFFYHHEFDMQAIPLLGYIRDARFLRLSQPTSYGWCWFIIQTTKIMFSWKLFKVCKFSHTYCILLSIHISHQSNPT